MLKKLELFSFNESTYIVKPHIFEKKEDFANENHVYVSFMLKKSM
jgi:hypothetical protein